MSVYWSGEIREWPSRLGVTLISQEGTELDITFEDMRRIIEKCTPQEKHAGPTEEQMAEWKDW